MIEIKPYGDAALLLNFEQKIDIEIHKLVKGYFSSIRDIEGVLYQIPAYCSITIVFNEEIIDYAIV